MPYECDMGNKAVPYQFCLLFYSKAAYNQGENALIFYLTLAITTLH